MLHFAYCSNMVWQRMRDRCPATQFLFKALLPDHELQFTRLSKSLRSGTADILPSQGSIVWGVVYDIDSGDRRRLDEKEGVGIGAYRSEDVVVLPEGDSRRALRVFTYSVCTKEFPRPKPSVIYMEFLIQGAKHWQLPEAYVAELLRVETARQDQSKVADALVREVASQAIKESPDLWQSLLYQLRVGIDADRYGSDIHMDFLAAVKGVSSRLTSDQICLLRRHIIPPSEAPAWWSFQDKITGEVFSRAKRVVARHS